MTGPAVTIHPLVCCRIHMTEVAVSARAHSPECAPSEGALRYG